MQADLRLARVALSASPGPAGSPPASRPSTVGVSIGPTPTAPSVVAAPCTPVGPGEATAPVQLSSHPEHETEEWSGRRGSNPRHAAWKAGTSERNSTVLTGPSET